MITHFTIHGDFITNHFRSIVLEGDWRRAVQDLKDSLIGITTDQVQAILAGKKKLTGVDQLDYEDDNKFEDKKFIESQYFTYFHSVYLINDQFYKRYDLINSSELYNFQKLKEVHDLSFVPQPESTQERLYLQYLLAKTKAKFSDDIVFLMDDKFAFFQKVSVDYPSWISLNEARQIISNKNVTELLNSFMIKIHGLDLLDFEPEHIIEPEVFLEQMLEQSKEVDFDLIKEKITLQAQKLGGFIELHDTKANKKYSVPKHPFLKWCLSESPLYRTFEWPAVSPQGIKCGGDDPNHTDWFLFTGYDLSIAQNMYNPNIDFFYKQRHVFHEKFTNTNLKPLIKGFVKEVKKYNICQVTQPEDISRITEKCIVVIPNADPLFTDVAHLCAKLKCPLITETGGPLCHLAVVGREFGLTLYLMNDAMSKLPKGGTASISYKQDKYDDSFTANIEVNDYSEDYTIQLLKLKLSGLYYK